VSQLLDDFSNIAKEYQNKVGINSMKLYINEATKIPLLSTSDEKKLTTEIAQQQRTWRAEILQSPLIQRKLYDALYQVCYKDEKIFHVSKNARNKHQSKLDLQNEGSLVMSRMKENLAAIAPLLDEQSILIRELANEKRSGREVEMTSALRDITRRIQILLEKEPVKDDWFYADSFNGIDSVDTELQYVKETMENASSSTAQGDAIEFAGETLECLTERMERVSPLYSAWQKNKQYLASANLRLVISIARKYRYAGLFLDLIEEGNASLLKCIDQFDVGRGNKFSTFATWWIRQGILRALSSQTRTVRIPQHKVQLQKAIVDFSKKFGNRNSRKPTHQEIADGLKISISNVESMLLRSGARSLDAPIGDIQAFSLSSILEDNRNQTPEQSGMSAGLRDGLLKALERLPERDRKILSLRYGLSCQEVPDKDGLPIVHLEVEEEQYGVDHSLEEVGAIFSLSRERIRQLEVIALKKLRDEIPEIEQYSLDIAELENYMATHKPKKPEKESEDRRHDIDICQVFEVRTSNLLRKHSVTTIGDLVKLSREDVCSWENSDSRAINQINKTLEKLGLGQLHSDEDITD